MKHIIEIELLCAGQPKPYADNVYEAIYTFSGGYDGVWTPTRETVIAHIKANYGADFFEKGEEIGPVAYLKTLEEVGEGKWHVMVVSP